MNLGTLSFHSKSMGRHVSYGAILPNPDIAGPGPYPVLIQLHGASDDHTAWVNRSNLFRHADGLPLIIIMPDGALSFWIDHNPREKYGSFLNEDLVSHVRSIFRVREGKMAIGGLSMGGYGALFNGLSRPDLYGSIWAHSSACWSKEDFLRTDISTPPADPDAADLFSLASRIDKGTMPELSFDCGTEDFLLNENRRFNKHLDDLGIPHRYKEHPGSHEWGYWDIHVREALEQHCRVLGITGK